MDAGELKLVDDRSECWESTFTFYIQSKGRSSGRGRCYLYRRHHAHRCDVDGTDNAAFRTRSCVRASRQLRSHRSMGGSEVSAW